jgi:hypothetical protein
MEKMYYTRFWYKEFIELFRLMFWICKIKNWTVSILIWNTNENMLEKCYKINITFYIMYVKICIYIYRVRLWYFAKYKHSEQLKIFEIEDYVQ